MTVLFMHFDMTTTVNPEATAACGTSPLNRSSIFVKLQIHSHNFAISTLFIRSSLQGNIFVFLSANMAVHAAILCRIHAGAKIWAILDSVVNYVSIYYIENSSLSPK